MKIALVLVAAASVAMGQQPEPALKGPTVATPAAKATLVEQDFKGRLKRLEIPPEEAALKLLSLDEATLKKTDKIIQERAAILDKAVIENLELVGQIHNAGQSGDKTEALQLFREFAKKLEPLKARGKLMEEIQAALPDEKQERYAALVREYHEAAGEDTVDQAASHGGKLSPREASGREVWTLARRSQTGSGR